MSRPKVLIVEDEPDIRRLYAIGLNQRGFEVKLAANGAEALERVEQERPDVLLLDWFLPLMRGDEVLDRLGVGADSPASMIIVVSGQEPPRELDPRIHRWLTKPISIDELVSEIESRAANPAANSQVR
jgi:DNA-binding response OmpR family regulator